MSRLDRTQTSAVEALTEADGQPISYAYLQSHGVSRPASVCYELAAAGWPVTRAVVTNPDGTRSLGARIRTHA